jgi:hypothetical protein
MEQMNKQTQTRSTDQGNQTTRRIIISVFGLVEAILAFRFIFKLFGANADNGFVKIIYGATGSLVGIFKGIFSQTEIDTKAVFEPETIIFMIVIALIAWVVLKLINPHAGESSIKTEYSKQEEDNK